ncbi:hypothetical protein OSTOST_18328 [Ostertagia ostertagi]
MIELHEIPPARHFSPRKSPILGKKYGLEGHEADENDFDALKWAAIMTGQSTDYLGTKERIQEGGKFKGNEYPTITHSHRTLSHAVESVELEQQQCFTSEPPTATFEEALEDFLAAYEIKPDWIENLLFISRIYLAKGDKVNAKKFLSKLLAVTPNDESEREMQHEAKKLLSKC